LPVVLAPQAFSQINPREAIKTNKNIAYVLLLSILLSENSKLSRFLSNKREASFADLEIIA